MKNQFDRIIISRKIFGIWFEITVIYREFSEDGSELFRNTRDHYKRIWGENNVRLRLYWCSETYDGNGKIIN